MINIFNKSKDEAWYKLREKQENATGLETRFSIYVGKFNSLCKDEFQHQEYGLAVGVYTFSGISNIYIELYNLALGTPLLKAVSLS